MNIEINSKEPKLTSKISNLTCSIALSIASLQGCHCIKDNALENIKNIPRNQNQLEQQGIQFISYSIECLVDKLITDSSCINVNHKEYCFDRNLNIVEQIADKAHMLKGVISIERDFRYPRTFHIQLNTESYRSFDTVNTIQRLSIRFNVFAQFNPYTNIITISK